MPHPDFLLDSLTAQQLSEWEASDRLEPLGEWRADYRLAFLSSTVWNIAIRLYGKKGAKMTKPKDFFIEWDRDPNEKEEPKRQSVEEMKKTLYDLYDQFKGNKKKEKGRSLNPFKKSKKDES